MAEPVYTASDDRSARKLDGSDGSQVWSFTGHTNDVSDVAVDADGYVYTAGKDDIVRKIDPDGNQVWSFGGHTSDVFAVDVDADGNVYSCSLDGTVRKINSAGVQQWVFDESFSFNDVAVGPDGYVYAAWDPGSVFKIDPDGNEVWEFITINMPTCVAVDANGFVYAGGGDFDETVYKIDSSGNEVWTFVGHGGRIGDVAVDEDGTYVYSSGGVFADDAVRKLDGSDGSLVWGYTGHSNDVNSIAVDVDGNVYSGSADNSVRKISPSGDLVWSFNHGQTVRGVDVYYRTPSVPQGTFEVTDTATVGWTGLAPATTPEGVFAVSDSTSAGFVGARTSAATFDVSDTTNVTWTGQSPAIPATFPVADNTDVTWVGTRTSVPGTFAVADDVTVAWTGLLPPTAASPNRLQNPSFETLLPAWGSGMDGTGGSTGTFSRTDVPSAFSGDFVGQYAIDDLATGYELYVERIPFAPSYLSRGVYIPAEERGEQLTFSFYHRRSDANGQTPQARLDIFFYDSGGTQISSQTAAAEWDLTQTSWSRSSLAAISIPATAHYFGFRMYFRMTSSMSWPAFTMLLDAFQVEFGATATPYQDTPVPTGTFATDVTDVVAWTGLSPAFSEYAVTDTVGVTWSGYRASAGTYEIDDIVTVPWFGQGPDVDRAVEVEVASRRELPWASGVLRRPVEVSGTTRSERTLDPVMRRAVPQSGTLRATHEVSVTTRAGREVGSTSRRRHDVAPARR